jgi:hypothetical protein
VHILISPGEYLLGPVGSRFINVSDRFHRLLTYLQLTPSQRDGGFTKYKSVIACLNAGYRGTSSPTDHARLVGSWGKNTAIRPPRDVDLLFELPWDVYSRFNKRTGNKQTQLLQEVKSLLLRTFPRTDVRGDGQVLCIPFQSYAVEVVPAFRLLAGDYRICDTKEGGRYKTTDPDAEIRHLDASDRASNGNTRDLIRMMKRWQAFCGVPLKSFWIELLAVEFLLTWEYRGKSTVYYDWMVRDFFGYLLRQAFFVMWVPGTIEIVSIGDSWRSRAQTAHDRAVKACEYENNKCPYLAGGEWQKIFDSDIPVG